MVETNNRRLPVGIQSFEKIRKGSELVLYQTGYLKIKDRMMAIYILGFPNSEVRKALYETVLPTLTSEAEQ